MKNKTLPAVLVLILCSCGAWAQQKDAAPKSQPDLNKLKAQSQALVETALVEMSQLQRQDNRIYAQGWIADLLWTQDTKRARALLVDAMAQCLSLAQQADPLQNENYLYRQSLESASSQLFNILVKRDSRLALDFVRQMRAATPNGTNFSFKQSRDWELSLAAQAVNNDPQLALQIAKDSLQDGLNPSLGNIWQGLQQKDPAAAGELFEACWNKVKTMETTPGQSPVQFISTFLYGLKNASQAGNEKPTGDEQRRRDIALRQFREVMEWVIAEALKVSRDDFLDEQNSFEKNALLQCLATFAEDIEKQMPQRAAAVRAKLNQFEFRLRERNIYTRYQKQIETKTSEELLALSKQAPPHERDFLVTNAIQKAVNSVDNEAQTLKLIQENIADPNQKQQMINQLTLQAALKASVTGKPDEVSSRLNQIKNVFERAQAFWQIAANRLSENDQKTGAFYLNEAATLVGERYGTQSALDMQLNFAQLYATLDPARAVKICEAAVDRLNVVIKARMTLNAYERGFQAEEETEASLWEAGNMVPYNLTGTLQKLVPQHFESVKTVTGRWQGREFQMHTLLSVARDLQQLIDNSSPMPGAPSAR